MSANLIGKNGTFVNTKGQTCVCMVTDYLKGTPFDDEVLQIDYVIPRTNEKVTGAYISVHEFRAE